MERKNKKLVEQWQFWIAMFVVGSIVFLIVINNKSEFKIYLNETEVDEIIACCLNLEEINSFENLTNNTHVGNTGINLNEEVVFCFPEENLKYFESPCAPIKKEDLDKEWLDWNAECLECYDKKTNSMTLDGCSFEYDKCFKYKFGEYFIEVLK